MVYSAKSKGGIRWGRVMSVRRRWRRWQLQGGVQLQSSGRGTRGAHVEHPAHGCDAGRVEVQRLVERRCALLSEKGSIGRRCRPGNRRAWRSGKGVGRVIAHLEHALHVRDAGGIEAQQLVERRRVLPSRERSIGRGAACEPGEQEGVGKRRRRKQRAGRTQLRRLPAGHARSAPKTCSPCP